MNSYDYRGPSLRLLAYRASDALVILVSDSGPGIDSGLLDKIFDPFFSLKPGGTGLGLSISYQLVRHHGGTIVVRKNLDAGLTFEIRLPASGNSREIRGGILR